MLTVKDILGGKIALDIECIDRVYLNGKDPGEKLTVLYGWPHFAPYPSNNASAVKTGLSVKKLCWRMPLTYIPPTVFSSKESGDGTVLTKNIDQIQFYLAQSSRYKRLVTDLVQEEQTGGIRRYWVLRCLREKSL